MKEIKSFRSAKLNDIADKFIEGDIIDADLVKWLESMFPKQRRRRKRAPPPENPRRARGSRRKREYAIMQSLFRKNMCQAAPHVHVLDGKISSKYQLYMK